ncbi:hypothetical protein [Streptomyces sp. NPDC020983]|uniref:hypothetical protein n=1 Tax=Streptomyces sp. NPDC020983 TaxID=3365106 RepID=UPI00379EFAC1
MSARPAATACWTARAHLREWPDDVSASAQGVMGAGWPGTVPALAVGRHVVRRRAAA